MVLAATPTVLPSGPPGRRVLPRLDLFGRILRMAADPADQVRVRVGPVNVVLVKHPDLVHEVLVASPQDFSKGRSTQATGAVMGQSLLTSEEPLHRERRRFLQPAFHRARMEAYAVAMIDLARQHADTWHDGQRIDALHEAMGLTLAIVSRTLFGADLGPEETRRVEAAMHDALGAFELLVVLPRPELSERLPLPRMRAMRSARTELDAVVLRLLAQRRAQGGDAGDLLSMLVQTGEDGLQLDDREARDEAMTALLTGHETTANALAWTWYLLAQHPEAEARLAEEAQTVLGGRPAEAADLPRLTWTRQVFAESLRLFPPVWALVRRARRDHRTSYGLIPAGSVVVATPYVLHRDARWWPDPDRFDPERFAPGAETGRSRHAFVPFGAGSRICIGEHFAWTEGVLVLATIASRWRLALDPGQQVRLDAGVTLRPRDGLPMTVRRRG